MRPAQEMHLQARERPIFILRNWDSFLENYKNLLKRRPVDVLICLSDRARLFLEHIPIALFSYSLNGQ